MDRFTLFLSKMAKVLRQAKCWLIFKNFNFCRLSLGGFKHEVQHGTLIDENTIYVNLHRAGAEAVQPKRQRKVEASRSAALAWVQAA